MLILPALLLLSCGKKEDTPQTQQTAENQQQMTQPPVQQEKQQIQTQPQSEQQVQKQTENKEQKNQADIKKEDSKKTTDADKYNPAKDSDLVADINFAPIFSKHCVKCHGKDGKGKAEEAPDFTSAKFKKKSDKELFNSIMNGIKAKNPEDDDMPAWKGKLTELEIKAAIKYVKSF
jgi:mono/diheme cytochrome c family protein